MNGNMISLIAGFVQLGEQVPADCKFNLWACSFYVRVAKQLLRHEVVTISEYPRLDDKT